MHEKPIPGFTLYSAKSNAPPPAMRVRRSSPQFEYEAWDSEPGDPEESPPAWNPLTTAANKIAGWMDAAADAGTAIYNQAVAEAKDVVSTVNAALTGEAPDQPGYLFAVATKAAERLASTSGGYQKWATKTQRDDNLAGFVTLPDGRQIPVAKYADPISETEAARSKATAGALRPGNLDAAAQRSKDAIERARLKVTQDQWALQSELAKKQEARNQRLFDLQATALEYANRRAAPTQGELQTWWLPQTTKPDPPIHRTVRAIGSGVPGGIQERLY